MLPPPASDMFEADREKELLETMLPAFIKLETLPVILPPKLSVTPEPIKAIDEARLRVDVAPVPDKVVPFVLAVICPLDAEKVAGPTKVCPPVNTRSEAVAVKPIPPAAESDPPPEIVRPERTGLATETVPLAALAAML